MITRRSKVTVAGTGVLQDAAPDRRGPRSVLGPYLELSKARLTSLVLATTLVGYLMGTHGHGPAGRMLWTLLGTGLCAAGANALNQWEEVLRDARMERTRHRPLPMGIMSRRRALIVSLIAALAGVGILGLGANLLTAALGAFVILLYVFVYTPLKHRTPFCTLVGAVCGAIPPMMGWTGATGSLALGAWILGLVLFLWQIPHFMALAWLYRADYLRGGFRMLPAIDPSGRLLGRIAVLYTIALLPLGVLTLLTGIAGFGFLAGSVVLGAGLFLLGWRLQKELTDRSARRLFLGSLVYLPLLLALMVADRGPAGFLRVEQGLAAVNPADPAEGPEKMGGPPQVSPVEAGDPWAGPGLSGGAVQTVPVEDGGSRVQAAPVEDGGSSGIATAAASRRLIPAWEIPAETSRTGAGAVSKARSSTASTDEDANPPASSQDAGSSTGSQISQPGR